MIALVTPALAALAHEIWSDEQGGHGPFILLSGLWLLWREAKGVRPAPVALSHVALLLLPALLTYLFGRIAGPTWLTWLSAYAVLLTVAYAYLGKPGMRQIWFPLVYLLFLVPPPYFLVGSLTKIIKLWLGNVTIDLLSLFDLDVAVSGTMLYIDQYEILLADACSGLNSIFSLMAIGLFYVYVMHRNEWRYALILTAVIIPIAIFSNMIRVIALLLVTKYYGDAAAQGAIHEAAGLIMFFAALCAMIMVDGILGPVRRRLSAR